MNPTTKLYSITLVLLILFLMPAIANAGTIYVDASKSDDNGDGQSWATAKKYLQSALALANSGDEIWVAQGTYYPDEGTGQINNPLAPHNPLPPLVRGIKGDNDRNSTFRLKEGVSIYGGFVGGETSRDQRDWANNPTILNGDLDKSGGKTDNDAYHVVTGANNAILDGFIITGGNANGDYPNTSGGGMYNYQSSPTLTNCTFSQNSASYDGGGMYNYSSSPMVTNCTFSSNSAQFGGGMCNNSSSSMVTNCTFSSNSANWYGGGMYNLGSSSPTVTNCTFSSNSAYYGGGMYNLGSSSPTVTNCTFSSNSASQYGGGMCNLSSSPTVTDCTFSQNSAWFGGGMYNHSSSPTVTKPTVTNCTFSQNSAGYVGGGMSNFWYSSPTVTNCTFSQNSADYWCGGMYNPLSSPTVTNCILWGDSESEIYNFESTPTITYCDVQGGYAGTGNIDADPLFTNPAAGDYHLNDYSPCIGAGTSEGAPAYDIEGNPRGTPPDMGAYENSRDVPLAVTLAELTALSATDSITIKWQTATETNNLGFNVYRSDSKDGKYIKVNSRLIAGAGSDATQHDYSFTDENVALGKTYYYYIEDVDYTGKTNKSHLIEVTVGKQGVKTHLVPPIFALLQNFPNPFNPETWIPFKLAKDADVVIRIYDAKGELVRTISLGNQSADVYVTKDKAAYWDGKNEQGERVSSGVYFYTLKVEHPDVDGAGEFKATRRMLIVK